MTHHTSVTHRRVASSGTLLALSGLLFVGTPALTAQSVPPADTLYLDLLQHAAERTDRRAPQLELLTQQSALRLTNIRIERRPSIVASGSAQYLSDVPSIGIVLPGGVLIPRPANEQYDSYLSVRQPLYDPTRARRVAVESAQQAEGAARLAAAVWQQRSLVNDAFFAVLMRDAQRRALDAAIQDLESRRSVAAMRVTAGTALSSEMLLVEAELSRRTQARHELEAERDAAVEVLAALSGQSVPATAVLAVRGPAASAPVAMAPAMPGGSADRARPEYAQFDRARDLITARREALAAQDLPRLSLVGRTGYGRPGLNPLGRNFDSYLLAGVQLEWNLWNWRRTNREAEVQSLQADIVASDEGAFSETVRRAAIMERGRMTALERGLQDDEVIVSLRERILQETRLRYDEGEVNSADYIARLTEQLTAQLEQATRRVRLLESRARYLTILGREVR